MVLESIINPFKAQRRPWIMLLVGLLYSSVAVFLALWIFRDNADLVMVFFTVMACMPFFYFTVKNEEQKSSKFKSESSILKSHSTAISSLIYLFIGIVLSFSFWYVIFPPALTQAAFAIQTKTILSINNQISGAFSQPFNTFIRIFFNNMKVLTFCILFAFIFGLGAVFILTWNASVIAVAIGNFIKSHLTTHQGAYLQAVSLGLTRYFLHGIPEIAAYFIGGLAGGVISVAVIRHSIGTRRFEKTLLDSSGLILLAILVLVIAALMEVYLTPLLF
ncbi:stage II sporulation protein M [Candidatus Woesearchaeota archaeon]|nr:stage II sporulation protein M [Candidatus Woesearchaeota archaeon]